MKVKELIKKLMELDPDQDIILDEEQLKKKNNTGRSVYALDLFLEEEIPFRLSEIIGVSDEDLDRATKIVLKELCTDQGDNSICLIMTL